MRALVCTALAGPSALEVRDIDEPSADGRVLVDVHAAGVAFPDLLLTYGRYQLRLDPPFVPGVEMAGVVRAAPDDAPVAVGDRVMGYTMHGALAERVAVDPAAVFGVPDGMSMAQAAGFIMNHQTAHFALHRRGRLAAGETVLVHGAAGGVGTAAIQVAKGGGARVVAAASSPEKRALAASAGADDTVDSDGFLDEVRRVTDGRGVDVVFDPVGGDRFTDNIRALAPEGRVLIVGFAAGGIPEVRVNRLLLNNVSLVGVAWGAFLLVDPGVAVDIHRDLVRLFDDGRLTPVVGTEVPLDDAVEAFRMLEERRAQGKLVVTLR